MGSRAICKRADRVEEKRWNNLAGVCNVFFEVVMDEERRVGRSGQKVCDREA